MAQPDPQRLASISIVLPCRNHRHYLEHALDSLISQNYPKLELIVMDGGSSDDTLELLKRKAAHLHYWCSEPDGGQYEAINRGFARSTGEVMGWLNADDMLLPGSLWTLGSIFAQLPEVEWLTTSSPLFMDASGSLIYCHVQAGYSKKAFLDGMHLPGQEMGFFGFIQQESTFWRRSLWERAGPLDTSYTLAADFDLWSKFIRHATSIYSTPAPLGSFRFTTGQRSHAAYQEYLAEARRSLRLLRRDLGWGITFKERLWEKIFGLRFRGITLRSFLKSYRGLSVVRCQHGSPDRAWKISPLEYYHRPLSNWLPHLAD